MGDPSLVRGAATIVCSKARACDSTPAREGHTPSAPPAPSVLRGTLSRLVAGRTSENVSCRRRGYTPNDRPCRGVPGSLQFDKGRFVLRIDSGDASEAGYVLVYFDAKGVSQRMVYSALTPEKPSEDTRYFVTVVEDK